MALWVWEWHCHGLRWELIPSRRYPERNDFRPLCPVCGGRPPRRWLQVEHRRFR